MEYTCDMAISMSVTHISFVLLLSCSWTTNQTILCYLRTPIISSMQGRAKHSELCLQKIFPQPLFQDPIEESYKAASRECTEMVGL